MDRMNKGSFPNCRSDAGDEAETENVISEIRFGANNYSLLSPVYFYESILHKASTTISVETDVTQMKLVTPALTLMNRMFF